MDRIMGGKNPKDKESLMFDSKGSYSVKLSKVVEKFNLENLTPEINIKKIIILSIPC